MTITEHKRLVAAIPEDLKEGEEIDVSSDGCNWCPEIFRGYGRCGSLNTNSHSWRYARRPAAAQKKRLKDEPWPEDQTFVWRWVDFNGIATASTIKPRMRLEAYFVPLRGNMMHIGFGYDSTDWQNSLERRPE